MSNEEFKLEFKPCRIEEIPEDLDELELMWNLRLFPFVLRNKRLFHPKRSVY